MRLNVLCREKRPTIKNKVAQKTKKAVGKKYKLPNKLKVGGVTLPIFRKVIHDSEQAYGFYTQTDNSAVICVDSRLSGHRELATFMHELFHAIDDVGGLGLAHRQIEGLGELTAQALERYFR